MNIGHGASSCYEGESSNHRSCEIARGVGRESSNIGNGAR